jgi:hypothetical protein
MYDLQVVLPVEVIELSSVTLLGGVTPSTIRVVGKDFRTVARVTINDIESPALNIKSRTVLEAQVPDIIDPLSISAVQVMSNQLTLSPQNLLQFRLLDVPTAVNGFFRLIQLFVKILLTTPGRDIFSPNLGGGALRGLGRSYAGSEASSLVSDLHIAVKQTVRQMLSVQARSPRTPLQERLQNASVVNSTYNRDQQALYASIELLNQTNMSAALNLTL